MVRCLCSLDEANGIEISSLCECYLAQSHKIGSILNEKNLPYYAAKRRELLLLMFELSYSCYVRKKICVTSLHITNMDLAIGKDQLNSVHKLVALSSNSMGYDLGDGNNKHYNSIPHVSALDGIPTKIVRSKRNCFSIADLRQQKQIKLKDTKNELGHCRHVFGMIIIIVI